MPASSIACSTWLTAPGKIQASTSPGTPKSHERTSLLHRQLQAVGPDDRNFDSLLVDTLLPCQAGRVPTHSSLRRLRRARSMMAGDLGRRYAADGFTGAKRWQLERNPCRTKAWL